MVENFHSIKESVQKFARNTLSFELVPREQLSILMEVIKLSYCSMKIAAPRTYMIYICVCVPVPSLRPLVSNQLWGRKNGRKNYSWTSKIKMDTVRGWNFPSINFYCTKIVPWNSLLFAVILHIFNLFFFIYISFFLSYSVLSLHFQSSRSFRIGYFSPRKNVPGITVCNDNSETTILSIAALEKRRFLFIFSLFFSFFSFFYFNRLSRIGRPLLSITKCISSSSMRSCRYIYILNGLELSWRKIDSMTHVRLI